MTSFRTPLFRRGSAIIMSAAISNTCGSRSKTCWLNLAGPMPHGRASRPIRSAKNRPTAAPPKQILIVWHTDSNVLEFHEESGCLIETVDLQQNDTCSRAA